VTALWDGHHYPIAPLTAQPVTGRLAADIIADNS
jgi:hypothetical protein